MGLLDRRKLLGTSIAAGAAALLPRNGDSEDAPRPQRATAPPVSPGDQRSALELSVALRAGSETSERLVAATLEAIEAIDRSGPALRSVIEVNPDAPALAAAADRERREGRIRGPLHGIPVLLKDNIDTADRMRTSAGSLALAESTPSRDAPLVVRLRDSGAVIVGKTNLSEWANIRSTRSTSGWSGRGGLTRNPYALDRNTSGSSSGSASAVAAGIAPLAVGTETDGSVISPSSICGLVGLKPTIGLLPAGGIVPISHTQDTAGPMGRSVADVALLLEAMGGGGFRSGLSPQALAGVRIGVARSLAGFHADVDRRFEDALAALRAAGAVLVDPANPAHLGKFDEAELDVLLYELKDGLARYLASLPAAPVRNLPDLVAWNARNADREMKWFGQELFEKAAALGPLSEPRYRKALALCRRLAGKEGLAALFAKHRLEGLVQPSNAPAWVTDLVDGDHYIGGNTSYAAVAGWPSLTVPMGEVHGLPVGISFTAPPNRDGRLLAFGHAFELATRHRRPPTFRASLEA